MDRDLEFIVHVKGPTGLSLLNVRNLKRSMTLVKLAQLVEINLGGNNRINSFVGSDGTPFPWRKSLSLCPRSSRLDDLWMVELVARFDDDPADDLAPQSESAYITQRDDDSIVGDEAQSPRSPTQPLRSSEAEDPMTPPGKRVTEPVNTDSWKTSSPYWSSSTHTSATTVPEPLHQAGATPATPQFVRPSPLSQDAVAGGAILGLSPCAPSVCLSPMVLPWQSNFVGVQFFPCLPPPPHAPPDGSDIGVDSEAVRKETSALQFAEESASTSITSQSGTPKIWLGHCSRCGRFLHKALDTGRNLEPVRNETAKNGQSCLLDSGARIFVHPEEYDGALAAASSHVLRPHHVIVSEAFKGLVEDDISALPKKEKVRVKRWDPLAI